MSANLQSLTEPDKAGSHHTALDHLYGQHGARLADYVRRLLGHRGDAEDIVQDVFIQLWRHAGSYDAGRGTVSAWLTAMARSRALDVLRGRGAVKRSPLVDAAQPTSTPATEWSGLDFTRLREAIAALPEAQRRLIDLAYFDGLTHSEIAAAARVPLGTVKTRLHMAVASLRLAVPREAVSTLVSGPVRDERGRVSRLLADRLLGSLSDMYFIDMIAAGATITRRFWGHVDPAVRDDLDKLWRFVPGASCDRHPVRQVVTTALPQLVPYASSRWQREVTTSEAHGRMMSELKLESLVCQPIVHQRRLVGALTLVRTTASGAHYRAQDLHEIRQVAATLAAVTTVKKPVPGRSRIAVVVSTCPEPGHGV